MPPPKGSGARRGATQQDWRDWMDDYRAAKAHFDKLRVEERVNAAGGLVRIENVLPLHVAEGILATLQAIPPGAWLDTSAHEDYTQNNIDHSFASVRAAPASGGAGAALQSVLRLFSLCRPPGALHTFSAARYCHSDHIAPHDDRAYTKVQLDNGRIITASRSLAIIYYLTRDWRPEYGGVLLDLEDPAAGTAAGGGGKPYVPQFNSIVAFCVPRYHAVTPLTTSRPRYSIFGWFLEPGKTYPLYRGDEGPQQAQGAATAAAEPQAAAAAAAARASAADAAAQLGRAREQGPGAGAAGAGAGQAAAAAAAEGGRQAGHSGWRQAGHGAAEAGQGRGAPTAMAASGAAAAAAAAAGQPAQLAGAKRAAAAGAVKEEAKRRRKRAADGGEGASAGSGSAAEQRAAALGARVGGAVAAAGAVHARTAVDAAARAAKRRALRHAGAARLPSPWQGRRKHACV